MIKQQKVPILIAPGHKAVGIPHSALQMCGMKFPIACSQHLYISTQNTVSLLNHFTLRMETARFSKTSENKTAITWCHLITNLNKMSYKLLTKLKISIMFPYTCTNLILTHPSEYYGEKKVSYPLSMPHATDILIHTSHF